MAHFDFECEQMDVVTAFLYGELEEDIFIEIPEVFRNENTSKMVCKLLKAVYGLKQAPKQWYHKIHTFLVDVLGFRASQNDPCVYILHRSSSFLVIAIYIDDLLMIGSEKLEIDELKDAFKKKFEMKDLGSAKVMLGLEITRQRNDRNLFLTQKSYIESVLTKFGMDMFKTVQKPMLKLKSSRGNSQAMYDRPSRDVPYRQAIGCLMYAMIGTRPDIAFAIGALSQHLEAPREYHWIAVKRILRYLNGTKAYGITYDGSVGPKIIGYFDSDWAGCEES